MEAEQTFIANLPVIERIVSIVAHRHDLDADTADDFASWVKERLIDDDYAVIRKFTGRSSMATYLAVVITNLLRDFNTKRWGRWRPSAHAKRLGSVAVRLEALLYRDNVPFSEALARLRSRDATTMTDRELARLAMQLPPRVRSRQVGAETLSDLAAPDAADHDILADEAATVRDNVYAALHDALGALPDEDQLIMRLRFMNGASVADISRALRLEQKPLYRRIDRLLATLRGRLEAAGVDARLLHEGIEVGS